MKYLWARKKIITTRKVDIITIIKRKRIMLELYINYADFRCLILLLISIVLSDIVYIVEYYIKYETITK